MTMRKLLIIFSILAAAVESIAQDIQLSQFYAMPLYMNPAFAGSSHHYRGIVHQRLQWMGLDARYPTSIFAVDGYSNQYKSGLAMMFTNDRQGKGGDLKTNDFALQYSYEIHLSSKYTLRTGLQGSYVQRSIDLSDKTFPQQFDNTGQIAYDNPYGNGFVSKYVDLSSGAVFYSDKWWGAVSAYHMNRPNQSFFDNTSSNLPVKYTFFGGYRFTLAHPKHMAYLESEKEVSLTPTFHYKMQGKSDQLDIGLYFVYAQLQFATWYRGIPIKHYTIDASNLSKIHIDSKKRIQNNESLVLLAGWRYGSFSFTYSYDFTISTLTQAGTGGSHEINLTFIQHKHHKNAKPMKTLPCPTFYKGHHDKHHVDNTHHESFQHTNTTGGEGHKDKDAQHHVEHHQVKQPTHHKSKHHKSKAKHR